MPHRRSTFSKFIIENERRGANPDPDLTGLLNDIQTSCKFIASAVSRGALIARDDTATSVNVQAGRPARQTASHFSTSSGAIDSSVGFTTQNGLKCL